MNDNWTHIKPWGQSDNTSYWINGIYKIVCYNDGEYYAYFIQDYYQNWGDYVSTPPDNSAHGGKCWNSLVSAKQACTEHSLRHAPRPKTVIRAQEIKAAFIEKEAARL